MTTDKTVSLALTFKDIDSGRQEVLRRQVASGCSDLEIEYFLSFCASKNLDPFARQVYAIKRGDKMTIQTGVDGFRAIANRTGTYAPGDESFEVDEKGKLVSATVSAKKLVAGTWMTFSATAHFVEFYQDRNPLWKTMPRRMLSKCAECLVLRKGWPEDLGGIYGDVEMERAETPAIVSSDAIKATIESPRELPAPKTTSSLPDIPETFTEVPEIILSKLKISATKKAELSGRAIGQLSPDDMALIVSHVQPIAEKSASEHNRKYLMALVESLQEAYMTAKEFIDSHAATKAVSDVFGDGEL